MLIYIAIQTQPTSKCALTPDFNLDEGPNSMCKQLAHFESGLSAAYGNYQYSSQAHSIASPSAHQSGSCEIILMN